MGKLVYSMITSLDGYVSDPTGSFAWAEPDEELHRFVNDQVRSVGTFLYGRRMYETMAYWENAHTQPGLPSFVQDFARTWQAADKVVYSTTLGEVRTARTRLERVFDPEAVRRWKAATAHDLTVDGPTLAAHAVRAGLVDEYQLYLSPAIVGGGTPFFPQDVRVDLELLEERRLGAGTVFLRYAVTGGARP